MIRPNLNMSTKILLAIILVWGLLLLVSVTISFSLKSNYLELEDTLTKEDIIRVKGGIKDLNATLNTQAATWAIWDDAYQYAEDRNEEFAKINLIPSTAEPVTGVDMMLTIDAKGKILKNVILDDKRTGSVPAPATLLEDLKPNGALGKYLINPPIDKIVDGLLATNEGILLLGSHPIVRSDGTGPPRGTWFMVGRFNKAVVDKLSETTKLDLSLYPMDAMQKDKTNLDFYKKSLANKDVLVDKINSKTLNAYMVLRDLNNKPIGMIKAEIPRTVYQASMKTLYYFNIVLLVAGILFAVALYYFLQRFMIKRLNKMHAAVAAIQKSKDFSITIPEKGGDEISSLAKEANKTLSIINNYDEQNKKNIQAISDALTESESLTSKLRITEKFLSDLINSMPSVLVIVNKHLEIVRANTKAEKDKKLVGVALITEYPYLESCKNLVEEAIGKNVPRTVNRIPYTINGSTHYYNIVIYPLSKEKLVSIRIDDITKLVKIEETLLQNDKLASIGVLTAGVAHEINNPINFVLSAVTPLKQDVEDIETLLKKYRELETTEDKEKLLKEINDYIEQIELNSIFREIQTLVNGMQDGILRTNTIINDLQSASRTDVKEMDKVNVNESIDSSLTLLAHRYKDRIKIIRNYGEVPLISGYHGRLNQVFVNVLANACDAIPDKGEIEITTESIDNNSIRVTIKDTGAGIPAEMLTKIFDPFFTTKEIGKGTGLGLSITRSILDEMHGKIAVKSAVGLGSEFIITLSVEQKEG